MTIKEQEKGKKKDMKRECNWECQLPRRQEGDAGV
jgi:hypothetical protein